jgi:hypothetical protein
MENLLEQSIPAELGEFILGKLDEYKAKVDATYRAKVEALEESYEQSAEKLFAFADKLIEDSQEETRKEYSAVLASRLEEKNEKIESLEEEVEDWKEELSEKVSAFLTNAKDEVRCIVEEEMRVDSEELKAQHLLEQIRAIVGEEQARIVSVEEGKVERLEADIESLKERVTQKTRVNESLKTQLHVQQLVESVPEADKEFYLDQLDGAGSINEADERFDRIKGAVRRSRTERLEEEFESFTARGELYESEDLDDIVLEERTEHHGVITPQMIKLANK